MSDDRPERIEPTSFRPPGSEARRRRRPLQPLTLAAAAFFGLLLAALWFVFTSQTVTLILEPPADTVTIRGGLSIPFGERHLARPGSYSLLAEKVGYHPLEESFVVPAGEDPTLRFDLTPLPGRLDVTSTPAGATVSIAGEEVGTTPLESVSLETGNHQVTLETKRHLRHDTSVMIEGRDRLQTLDVTLTPAWAPVTVRSMPVGASLEVDGEVLGTTPATVDLGAGPRAITLSLAGYEPWQGEVVVVPNVPQEPPVVELLRARAWLQVSSVPSGSNVTAGSMFQGVTPLTVRLPPDEPSRIRIARAGYRTAERTVTLAAGEKDELHVKLEAVLATIRLRATPADAEVLIDGKPHGSAHQDLALTVAPHRITIRKPGYVTHVASVTPKPGLLQELEVTLVSEAEVALRSVPAVIDSPAGQLRLLRPGGSFTMGAERREQGRRANEGLRRVRLLRPYYLGVHEVTNRGFRAFRPGHSSGIAARRKTLDNDEMPVVRVSWDDAIAFCNWLSERGGLPLAYEGSRLREPVGTGFRLPTEAEWAWAARFAGGGSLKYSWGNQMPPGAQAGNFADVSAVGIVDRHLREYDDGFPASAPVGRFLASPAGFFDLGGNVSEWVNDFYASAPGGASDPDPLGPSAGSAHTVRGSTWRHGRITELRLSYREAGTGARDDLGFRVARYAE